MLAASGDGSEEPKTDEARDQEKAKSLRNENFSAVNDRFNIAIILMAQQDLDPLHNTSAVLKMLRPVTF